MDITERKQLAEQALDYACCAIQTHFGNKTGDLAAQYFSDFEGSDMEKRLLDYIDAEARAPKLRDYTVVVQVATYRRVVVSARSEEGAQDKAIKVVSSSDHLDFEYDYEIEAVMLRD